VINIKTGYSATNQEVNQTIQTVITAIHLTVSLFSFTQSILFCINGDINFIKSSKTGKRVFHIVADNVEID
jgi:hypothetical protein